MKLFSHCNNSAQTREALAAWYGSALGRALHACENECVEGILQNLFGYHLLQVGCPSADDRLSSSRIKHHAVIDAYAIPALTPQIYGYPHALPVMTDTIDVVVLPHTLEFDDDPHEVLREIERVLIPEGHVIILSFNPWSLWGLWHVLLRRRSRPPWCGRFLSATRIKDWLALLGFDIVVCRRFFYRPPLQHETVMRRLNFIEALGRRFWPVFAGIHIIVAKKRVAVVTPIKPRWKPRRSSLVPDYAGPASRGVPRV